MSRFSKDKISLKELIPAITYRTVENGRCLKGRKEIVLNMELEKQISTKLSFETPWDGKIYGFVTPCNLLNEFFNELGLNGGVKLFISSWSGKLVFMVEDTTVKKEFSYYVEEQEVLDLLEGCLRPPSQRELDL